MSNVNFLFLAFQTILAGLTRDETLQDKVYLWCRRAHAETAAEKRLGRNTAAVRRARVRIRPSLYLEMSPSPPPTSLHHFSLSTQSVFDPFMQFGFNKSSLIDEMLSLTRHYRGRAYLHRTLRNFIPLTSSIFKLT